MTSESEPESFTTPVNPAPTFVPIVAKQRGLGIGGTVLVAAITAAVVGAGAGFGSFSTNIFVEPHTEAAAHYFVNGDQSKIVRKGYLEIDLKCAATYPPQGIDNGTFRNITAGFPDNWGTEGNVDSLIYEETYNQYIGFSIFCGSNFTTFYPNSVSKVFGGDLINLSFALKAIPIPSTPGIQVEIKITNGANQWKYTNAGWL